MAVTTQSATLATVPAGTAIATVDLGGALGLAQIVKVRDDDLEIAAVQATASGETELIAAPGAGIRLKLLRVEASNSDASQAVVVGLTSASLNAGAVFGKRYLPAEGGAAVWTFVGGYLLAGENEALAVNLSGAGQVELTAYFATVTI